MPLHMSTQKFIDTVLSKAEAIQPERLREINELTIRIKTAATFYTGDDFVGRYGIDIKALGSAVESLKWELSHIENLLANVNLLGGEPAATPNH